MRAAALLSVLLLCLHFPTAQAAECAPGQHRYAETRRIPATAMEDGEADYVCTACGHEYTDIIFATDHLWGTWVTDLEPACTQPGKRHRTCTRAQPHTETATIPTLGHAYKETRTEPTCLEPGKIIFICARDPAHAYEEPIPAPGSHSFGEWRTKTPAGEGAQGLETRGCARCGFVEPRVLQALPIAATEPPPEPVTGPPTEPPTEPSTEPPTEPPAEPPRTLPLMDIALVSANAVSWGFFAFLLIPYFLCLLYARKRHKAQEERDALRKEVDALYGYK